VAGACLLACGGFEPDFGPPPANATAGLAGWAYDAGVEPEVKPSAGSGAGGRPASTAGSGAGGRAGQTPSSDAGEGGERAEPEGGASGTGQAASGASGASSGAGASSAGAAGGGSSNAGFGGSSGAGGSSSGGVSGSTAGGRAGATGSGSAGTGGAASGAGGAAGNAGAAGSAGGPGNAVHALMFSEYVEGSMSFKALEIRALAASTLDGCRLATYFNGASEASGLALAGTLDENDVYVLCSTALAATLGAACDRPTNLSFNGDDAIVLECAGRAVDSIGQIAYDPGVSWDNGDASTVNRTLRRSCSVIAGDTVLDDAFDPASGWVTLPEDTFTGLGDPACE
jgi:hypothetical protein